MEIFKNTNFDFLGKKWPFIWASLVLTAAGLGSLAMKGGPKYGIDFAGGALMYVKFDSKPPVEKIRSALGAKIPGEISVQEVTGSNEVMIGTELKDEKSLEANSGLMLQTLQSTFGQNAGGKLDFHNNGATAIADRLRGPLQTAGVALSELQLQDLVKAMLGHRDTPPRSGLLKSFDELNGVAGVTPQVISVMKQECYLSPFTVRSKETVGPKVGAELRNKAILATLYALGGMLVYIAFRFEWIYGVAAVIAVFHDTVITVGLFSLFDKEVNLTVVAALLTLVGYSMNDTIVVFDRIRENMKTAKRGSFEFLVNASINQTLSRTILTSGLTFLSAVALFALGGQVLHPFSFALVVGILIGTYSSVFIASPILIFWTNFMEQRRKSARLEPAAAASGKKAR